MLALYDYDCSVNHPESLQVYARNDTTGTRQNPPAVIASETMRFGEFSAKDKMNGMASRPGRQQNSQADSHGTLSKEARRVDWKMKPRKFSSHEWSKQEEGVSSSGPMISSVEGGFHTQYVLFTKNNVASISAAAKSAFLLKVESNCGWERIRRRILEIILKQCPDNTFYPPVEQLHIDGFLVDILPKAEQPEVLPADVQRKMMSEAVALHAIGIRVTVDHQSPPSASLGTGLSAFSQLKLKFPSEPSRRNVKSSQRSFRLHEGSTAASRTFGSFSSRPANASLSPLAETVSQPQAVNVPDSGNVETSSGRLHTAKFTSSAFCPKPAILRTSLSVSLANSSSQLNSTRTYVDGSKLPLSNGSKLAEQSRGTSVIDGSAGNTQSFTSRGVANRSLTEASSSAFSQSAFSSFESTDSCSNSREKPNSQTLSIRGPESLKLSNDARDTVASSQTSEPVTESFMSQKSKASSLGFNDDDVIIVEDDDDDLSPSTSSCQLSATTDADAAVCFVQSSLAAELSRGFPSPVSVSHFTTTQTVSMHDSSTPVVVQSVPDVFALSETVVHPVPDAAVSGNGLCTVPITPVNSESVNIDSSLMMTQQLESTTSLQSIGTSPRCEHSNVQPVSEDQHNDATVTKNSTTRSAVTAVLFSDDVSFIPLLDDAEATDDGGPIVTQPADVSNEICGSDSLLGDEEKSAKIDSSAEQKHVDASRDMPVASSSVEVITSSEDELSLLSVELVESASTSTVNEQHQQLLLCSDTASEDVKALPDDSVEIVPSDDDEVCTSTFHDENNCVWH